MRAFMAYRVPRRLKLLATQGGTPGGSAGQEFGGGLNG